MPKNIVGQRRSEHISRKSAQNAFRAFDYAEQVLDSNLNLYIVLRLRPSSRASETTIFARVLHKFRDWHIRRLKQMGVADSKGPLYVATFENPDGHLPHVNWAARIHPALHSEFRRKVLSWLMKSQPVEVQPFDWSVQPIAAAYTKRLAKYLVKGVEPAFIDYFHLSEIAELHGPQGVVYGRRVLISLALNTSARDGWRPVRGYRSLNAA